MKLERQQPLVSSGRKLLSGLVLAACVLLLAYTNLTESHASMGKPAAIGPSPGFGTSRSSEAIDDARRRVLVRFRSGTEAAERVDARDAIDAEFVDS